MSTKLNKPMLILGIDTSCDDTSAAVVAAGANILSNIVSGQEAIHQKYGGIVPELASRRHIEMIWPVVDEALKTAGTGLDDISAIAACKGPGLIGSLLVGCSFAKAVSYSRNIPLVAVNHLEGHIFSSFLDSSQEPEFPFLSLIVSGGHTSLYRIDGFGRYKELGRTRDDAAGEAYDKIAKLLNLGYPGGPVIDRLAQEGDPDAIVLPRAYLPESFDFSFSGLKTAVKNTLSNELIVTSNKLQETGKQNSTNSSLVTSHSLLCDIAASFQAAVVDVLVWKVERAVIKEKVKRVALAGGVAANSALRKAMAEMAEENNVELYIPPVFLCTDNAAMIAAAGWRRFIAGDIAGLDLNPAAYLML